MIFQLSNAQNRVIIQASEKYTMLKIGEGVVEMRRVCLILGFVLVITMLSVVFASEEVSSSNWVYVKGENTFGLTLNSNGTMRFGAVDGTWSQKGSLLTLTTKNTEGSILEIYADIIEDSSGVQVIKTQSECRVNGALSKTVVMSFYPTNQVPSVVQATTQTQDFDQSQVTTQTQDFDQFQTAQLLQGIEKKQLGEMVSTDIIDVTVKKAALAYYANGVVCSDKGHIENIDEALEPSSSSTAYYKSRKGRCLLCIDFEITNTDRGTMSTSGNTISFSVSQNGKSVPVNAYDLNNKNGRPGMNLESSVISVNGVDFYVSMYGFTSVSSTILDPNVKYEIKYIGVVGFEPDGLDTPFEVEVKLKNSDDGIETFTYSVNG